MLIMQMNITKHMPQEYSFLYSFLNDFFIIVRLILVFVHINVALISSSQIIAKSHITFDLTLKPNNYSTDSLTVV